MIAPLLRDVSPLSLSTVPLLNRQVFMTEKHVLITGVSSGIGLGLAQAYLDRGCQVLGTSRRQPDSLVDNPQFRFQAMDLSQLESIEAPLTSLVADIELLDLVILNAGRLGFFGDLADSPPDDLQHTMTLNVWSCKTVLDILFARQIDIPQVVTISSGAAVNGNRGWSGYSISKAALNMLTKLYAKERPDTHFCAFAPGLVDTTIQDELLARQPDERYAAVEVLRSKRGTGDMPQPDVAAARFLPVFDRLPDLIESGDFTDIRQLRI